MFFAFIVVFSSQSQLKGKSKQFKCPARVIPYYPQKLFTLIDRLCRGPGCEKYGSRYRLLPTKKVVSHKGRFTLLLQTDGNLVLYDAQRGRGGYESSAATWSSGTKTTSKDLDAEISENGALTVVINKVVAYFTPKPRFSYKDAAVTFIVGNDGNFVCFQCDESFWASNTWTVGAM